MSTSTSRSSIDPEALAKQVLAQIDALLTERLHTLSINPQVQSSSTGTQRESRRARRQRRAALRATVAPPPPTRAATTATRVAAATAIPSLPEAALEKILTGIESLGPWVEFVERRRTGDPR